MKKTKTYILAALAVATSILSPAIAAGQTFRPYSPYTQPRIEVRPAPFNHGGYDVYQNGLQTQQIRQAPFTPGGYDVYQNGLRTQTIRPAPFNPGGYIINGY